MFQFACIDGVELSAGTITYINYPWTWCNVRWNGIISNFYLFLAIVCSSLPLWTPDCSMVFFLVFSINILVWFVQ